MRATPCASNVAVKFLVPYRVPSRAMTASTGPAQPRDAGEMVRMARAFLERKGVEEARLEAELLVAHALRLTRLQLFMQLDRPISAAEIDGARDLLVRRGKREPVAYITGEREFYGRAFRVGRGALVPRPETELLVDRAREIARERTARGDPPRFAADLGTGTGCIAATLALEIEGLDVLAVDSSAAALAWARENVAHLGARVELVEGEGFATLARIARERGRGFDLLLSNPPYVTESERASLAPEVRDHEPHEALFAPASDPDHFARRFLDEGRELLAEGGTILVELGHQQAPRVRALAEARGVALRLHKDFAGIERVVEIARAR
jgi:release factor glutamine methyltransferase